MVSENLSFSENFFKMMFNKVPDKEIVRAFDISLILYAEHSFCLLYTSPSPRDRTRSRMPSSA